MHHTDKRRISAWLKDLREKRFIEWIYDPDDPIDRTKPAIYYLGINGIRYLREHGDYEPTELRKRYTESSRKRSFIDRCLLLADCCLNVESASSESLSFSYILPTDYVDPDHDYHFLQELRPDTCFIKQKDGERTPYLLETFSASLPRYSLKKRIKDYINFLDEEIWQSETDDNDSPIVQLAFAKKADLIYAKRRAKFELTELYDNAIPEDIKLRFTTINKIREQGLTAKIWEKLKVNSAN